MPTSKGWLGRWALFVVLTLVVSACSDDAAPYVPAGIVRTPPPNVGLVSLPDVTADSTDFFFRAQPGEFLIVYFGYTSCPDICPTTMTDLRRALRDLETGADRVDVAFVTVDPDRDVPEVVTAYTQTFFSNGHALRTEDDRELRKAAGAFGALYDVRTNDEGFVEVGHSAVLYVVDDDGLLRLQWPFGTRSIHITEDLDALLEQEMSDE